MAKRNTEPTLDEVSITLEIGLSKFNFTLTKRRAIDLFLRIKKRLGITDLEYPHCVGCVRSSHGAHCAIAGSTCINGNEWLPKLKE